MKKVYTCFSTDVIHEGHLHIINEAKKFGRVVVGCLSDKASIRYNRFPTVAERERIELYRSIEGVDTIFNIFNYFRFFYCFYFIIFSSFNYFFYRNYI